MSTYLHHMAECKREVLTRIREDTVDALIREIPNSAVFWGQVSAHDATYLELHCWCFCTSRQELERRFGLRHSSSTQIFGCARAQWQEWARRQIYIPAPDGTDWNVWLTLQATERQVDALIHSVNERFQNVTYALDGVDIRIFNSAENRPEEGVSETWISHKLKYQYAGSFLAACDMVEDVIWLSECLPSGWNDIRKARETISDLKAYLDESIDLGSADSAFRSLQKKKQLKLVTTVPKPKGKPMSSTTVTRNKQLSQHRARIERVFGQIENKFSCLKMFKGRPAILEQTYLVMAAIYNNDHRIAQNRKHNY
jgi:hypothetical protein